jgi:hypothetical protein
LLEDNNHSTSPQPVVAPVQLEDLQEYVADWRDKRLEFFVLKGIQFCLSFCRGDAVIGDAQGHGTELAGRGGNEILPGYRDLV